MNTGVSLMSQKCRLTALALLSTLLATGAAAQLPTTNGWYAVPNTRLRPLCAGENGFSQVLGNTGCISITEAWNGGVFDSKRNRLVIWGGGHTDYYGNEFYAFNLDTLTVERLNDPGTPIASSCSDGIVNNTQANSRHTYDGIEYIAHLDKMYVFSGSLACGSGSAGTVTWLFNFATMQWERKNPTGTLPTGAFGVLTAYDLTTGLIYLHDLRYLYSYDAAADRYTRLSTNQASIDYHLAATLDPVRKKFVVVGMGRVYTHDISAGATASLQTLSTSGGGSVVGAAYPGVDYDPSTDRIVGWSGSDRNNVYSLNLDTGQWTVSQFTGGPPAAAQNGTHGRWRYSAKSGVFALANKVGDNIYVMRLSGTPAPVPNPPTALAVQ
jgi:hypothetical protein